MFEKLIKQWQNGRIALIELIEKLFKLTETCLIVTDCGQNYIEIRLYTIKKY